jgi:hypothetical protein
MADHLAGFVTQTPNKGVWEVQKGFEGTKVTDLARSPKVWCYTANVFFQALEQADSFQTRLVEVFHCLLEMVPMSWCRFRG